MKKNILYISLVFAIIYLTMPQFSFSQILITENSGGTPDASAMLQIDSETRGVLIPRITTANRLLISAVEGLLVYDSDEGSFYLYGSSGWTNLSSSTSEIWTKDASNVYLTNSDDNIGIGTEPSTSKFVVQANTGSGADDILFEVKDETGIPVFRVTSEGVRIYVKDKTQTKGVSGGFAVGQYGSLKDVGDEYLIVTADSTRVYTLPSAKGVSGGFAVGQYSSLKGGIATPNFYTNPGETRIYTEGQTKGVSGGFAVGQYGSLKASGDKYMHIQNDNIFIGDLAGVNSSGTNNVFIGSNAGASNTTGSGNIFVGNNAGSTVVSSNKLFIDNASSNSAVSLIYGDFTTKAVNLNGRLRFNTGGNSITMPVTRGATNDVLTINQVTGVANWVDVETLIPTFPIQYVPPTLFVTLEKDFPFKDEDNIGTLIVKTEEVLGVMTVFLPDVKNNHGRIITIKNDRPGDKINTIGLIPFEKDIIQDVLEYPLVINKGSSYTLQAVFDEKIGGIWYINSIYP